jgi:hypothetical protein
MQNALERQGILLEAVGQHAAQQELRREADQRQQGPLLQLVRSLEHTLAESRLRIVDLEIENGLLMRAQEGLTKAEGTGGQWAVDGGSCASGSDQGSGEKGVVDGSLRGLQGGSGHAEKWAAEVEGVLSHGQRIQDIIKNKNSVAAIGETISVPCHLCSRCSA